MNKCKEKVREECYGVVVTLGVMLISTLLSRSYLNQYFDVILYAGVFLVIGGIATMLLSCVL